MTKRGAASRLPSRAELETLLSADLRAITAQSDRIGRYFARQNDLSHADFHALLHIMVAETAGAPLTLVQLSQRLDVSAPAITYLVASVVARAHRPARARKVRCGVTDRWQYLILLGLCLAITAPLELFGDGVYRHPRRLVRSVAPVAAVFLVWDAVAVAARVWTSNPGCITGIDIPFGVPIEEVLFFVVIPLCALLTYNAVIAILDRSNRR